MLGRARLKFMTGPGLSRLVLLLAPRAVVSEHLFNKEVSGATFEAGSGQDGPWDFLCRAWLELGPRLIVNNDRLKFGLGLTSGGARLEQINFQMLQGLIILTRNGACAFRRASQHMCHK